MYNKKSITAVIATSLLVVVAVMALVNFESFVKTYQSQMTFEIESKNISNKFLRFDGIIGDTLYIYSGKAQVIKALKIKDSIGNTKCEYHNLGKNNSEGLIGYWNFDNYNSTDIFDSSRNQLHGKYTYIKFQPGISGESFSGLAKIPDNDLLDLNKNLTISFWFYADGYTNEYAIHLISKWTNTTDANFVFYYFGNHEGAKQENEGYIQYYSHLENEGWDGLTDYYKVKKLKKWYFIALTYDGNVSNFYFDDNKKSYYLNTLIKNNDNPLVLRMHGDIGKMDEVRIFNRTLSPLEIENLYNFNTVSLTLQEQTNAIPINGCNLTKNEVYELIALTDEESIQAKVLAK